MPLRNMGPVGIRVETLIPFRIRKFCPLFLLQLLVAKPRREKEGDLIVKVTSRRDCQANLDSLPNGELNSAQSGNLEDSPNLI